MYTSVIFASLGIVLPVLGFHGPSSKASSSAAADAMPGESSLFATYSGKRPPIPAEYLKAIPATGSGSPDPEDNMLHNLLGGEWVVYAFYQHAVETFSPSNFTKLHYPSSTYQSIADMRDNEAGHARIFQERISENSVKPGPCRYKFKELVGNDLGLWLKLQVYIEISSMAFLTGMINQAEFNNSRSTLMAIGQTESRHNAWALTEIFKTSPFSGPTDTVYPYTNQILDSMNEFIVPGSCPSENPTWPSPRQRLPMLTFNPNTTTAKPGSDIEFIFPQNRPDFQDKDYYAVFYHGLNNISVPYDPKKNSVKIPREFGTDAGLIIANIADEPHAPTADSVVAGPMFLVEQPQRLARMFSFT